MDKAVRQPRRLLAPPPVQVSVVLCRADPVLVPAQQEVTSLPLSVSSTSWKGWGVTDLEWQLRELCCFSMLQGKQEKGPTGKTNFLK